jgi:hypothetical protein
MAAQAVIAKQDMVMNLKILLMMIPWVKPVGRFHLRERMLAPLAIAGASACCAAGTNRFKRDTHFY